MSLFEVSFVSCVGSPSGGRRLTTWWASRGVVDGSQCGWRRESWEQRQSPGVWVSISLWSSSRVLCREKDDHEDCDAKPGSWKSFPLDSRRMSVFGAARAWVRVRGRGARRIDNEKGGRRIIRKAIHEIDAVYDGKRRQNGRVGSALKLLKMTKPPAAFRGTSLLPH